MTKVKPKYKKEVICRNIYNYGDILHFKTITMAAKYFAIRKEDLIELLDSEIPVYKSFYFKYKNRFNSEELKLISNETGSPYKKTKYKNFYHISKYIKKPLLHETGVFISNIKLSLKLRDVRISVSSVQLGKIMKSKGISVKRVGDKRTTGYVISAASPILNP